MSRFCQSRPSIQPQRRRCGSRGAIAQCHRDISAMDAQVIDAQAFQAAQQPLNQLPVIAIRFTASGVPIIPYVVRKVRPHVQSRLRKVQHERTFHNAHLQRQPLIIGPQQSRYVEALQLQDASQPLVAIPFLPICPRVSKQFHRPRHVLLALHVPDVTLGSVSQRANQLEFTLGSLGLRFFSQIRFPHGSAYLQFWPFCRGAHDLANGRHQLACGSTGPGFFGFGGCGGAPPCDRNRDTRSGRQSQNRPRAYSRRSLPAFRGGLYQQGLVNCLKRTPPNWQRSKAAFRCLVGMFSSHRRLRILMYAGCERSKTVGQLAGGSFVRGRSRGILENYPRTTHLQRSRSKVSGNRPPLTKRHQ